MTAATGIRGNLKIKKIFFITVLCDIHSDHFNDIVLCCQVPKARQVAFREEMNLAPQPLVALHYLKYLTADSECRQILFDSCRAEVHNVCTTLIHVTVSVIYVSIIYLFISGYYFMAKFCIN